MFAKVGDACGPSRFDPPPIDAFEPEAGGIPFRRGEWRMARGDLRELMIVRVCGSLEKFEIGSMEG